MLRSLLMFVLGALVGVAAFAVFAGEQFCTWGLKRKVSGILDSLGVQAPQVRQLFN